MLHKARSKVEPKIHFDYPEHIGWPYFNNMILTAASSDHNLSQTLYAIPFSLFHMQFGLRKSGFREIKL